MFEEINISTIWDDFLKGVKQGFDIYGDLKTQEQKQKNQEIIFSSLGNVLPLIVIGLAVVLIFAFKK